MLANFLAKSKPINYVILLSFFLILSLIGFVVNTPLYFTALQSWAYLPVIAGLFALIAFFYNFIITKNRLTKDNTYHFLFFLVSVSLVLPLFLNYKNALLFLVYLLFLRKIYSLKSKKNSLKKLFDAGFWLSILCLLKPSFIFFYLFVYAAILIYKKVNSRNLLAPIIGFLPVLISYFAYCFWQGKTYLFTNLFYYSRFKYFNLQNYQQIAILFLVVLVLLFFLLKVKHNVTYKINVTKAWVLVIINFLVCLSYIIITKNLNNISVLLFPTSIIIANGLEVLKHKLLKNSLLLLILLFAIISPFLIM